MLSTLLIAQLEKAIILNKNRHEVYGDSNKSWSKNEAKFSLL